MRAEFRGRWLALLAAVVFVLMTAAGCGGTSGSSAGGESAKKDLNAYERLEQLRTEMSSRMPAQYCTGMNSVSDYQGPDSPGALEQWLFTEQMKLLEPAVEMIAAEEYALVSQFAPQEAAGVSSGDALPESGQGDYGESPAELYRYFYNLENDLFSGVNVELLEENKSQLKVVPVLSTDSGSSVWLTLYTNFRLPGFEDMERGFMLRLDLDGGKTEQTAADSIYSYQNIRLHSSHCVSFNLSAILSKVTAQDYLSGRNRITFTVFELDNDFSYSCEFYKLRYAENEFSGLVWRREELAKIILEAV